MKSIPPIHKLTGYLTGNIYIIEDEELTLVDTGIPRDYNLVVDRIKSLGRSPVEVGHILLTHFHVDHAGSAAGLKRLSTAKVYAHEAETPCLEGTEEVSSVYRLGVLGRAASLFPTKSAKATMVPPVEVDVSAADGEVLPLLGGIRVIHTPGHTPGSACYLWEEKGILFTGDTIIDSYRFFTLPTIGFSCDYDEAAESACKVVDAVEDGDVWLVCPGHGPFVDKYAKERLQRFRGRLMKRDRSPAGLHPKS